MSAAIKERNAELEHQALEAARYIQQLLRALEPFTLLDVSSALRSSEAVTVEVYAGDVQRAERALMNRLRSGDVMQGRTPSLAVLLKKGGRRAP